MGAPRRAGRLLHPRHPRPAGVPELRAARGSGRRGSGDRANRAHDVRAAAAVPPERGGGGKAGGDAPPALARPLHARGRARLARGRLHRVGTLHEGPRQAPRRDARPDQAAPRRRGGRRRRRRGARRERKPARADRRRHRGRRLPARRAVRRRLDDRRRPARALPRIRREADGSLARARPGWGAAQAGAPVLRSGRRPRGRHPGVARPLLRLGRRLRGDGRGGRGQGRGRGT